MDLSIEQLNAVRKVVMRLNEDYTELTIPKAKNYWSDYFVDLLYLDGDANILEAIKNIDVTGLDYVNVPVTGYELIIRKTFSEDKICLHIRDIDYVCCCTEDGQTHITAYSVAKNTVTLGVTLDANMDISIHMGKIPKMDINLSHLDAENRYAWDKYHMFTKILQTLLEESGKNFIRYDLFNDIKQFRQVEPDFFVDEDESETANALYLYELPAIPLRKTKEANTRQQALQALFPSLKIPRRVNKENFIKTYYLCRVVQKFKYDSNMILNLLDNISDAEFIHWCGTLSGEDGKGKTRKLIAGLMAQYLFNTIPGEETLKTNMFVPVFKVTLYKSSVCSLNHKIYSTNQMVHFYIEMCIETNTPVRLVKSYKRIQKLIMELAPEYYYQSMRKKKLCFKTKPPVELNTIMQSIGGTPILNSKEFAYEVVTKRIVNFQPIASFIDDIYKKLKTNECCVYKLCLNGVNLLLWFDISDNPDKKLFLGYSYPSNYANKRILIKQSDLDTIRQLFPN